MVNKVALGILAVIILTAMTVGGLVGLQLSGNGALGDGTPTPTPTPAPQSPAEPPEATDSAGGGAGEGTPTPTATPTPSVSPADLNRALIEEEVRAEINDERAERDMEPLELDEAVREMARNHSRTMGDLGYVSHSAGGLTTQERYKAFDLADRCRIPNNSNRGIETGQSLETLSTTSIGANYTFEETNRTIRVENETQIARAVVDGWLTTDNERPKLFLEQATVAGVGVVVTDAGDVYVTNDLC